MGLFNILAWTAFKLLEKPPQNEETPKATNDWKIRGLTLLISPIALGTGAIYFVADQIASPIQIYKNRGFSVETSKDVLKSNWNITKIYFYGVVTVLGSIISPKSMLFLRDKINDLIIDCIVSTWDIEAPMTRKEFFQVFEKWKAWQQPDMMKIIFIYPPNVSTLENMKYRFRNLSETTFQSLVTENQDKWRAYLNRPIDNKLQQEDGSLLPSAKFIEKVMLSPRKDNFFNFCFSTNGYSVEQKDEATSGFYRLLLNDSDTFPYGPYETLGLTDYYMRQFEPSPVLDEECGLMNGKKISWCLGELVSDKPADFENKIATLLQQEMSSNPSRPEKFFIHLNARNNATMGHAMFVCVEPSSVANNEARITVFNALGDSITLFREFEDAILRGAKRVYNSDKTTLSRNTKPLYVAHGTCGPDALEYMVHLAGCNNVQAAVEKGLVPRTSNDNVTARAKHKKDYIDYMQKLIDGTL